MNTLFFGHPRMLRICSRHPQVQLSRRIIHLAIEKFFYSAAVSHGASSICIRMRSRTYHDYRAFTAQQQQQQQHLQQQQLPPLLYEQQPIVAPRGGPVVRPDCDPDVVEPASIGWAIGMFGVLLGVNILAIWAEANNEDSLLRGLATLNKRKQQNSSSSSSSSKSSEATRTTNTEANNQFEKGAEISSSMDQQELDESIRNPYAKFRREHRTQTKIVHFRLF